MYKKFLNSFGICMLTILTLFLPNTALAYTEFSPSFISPQLRNDGSLPSDPSHNEFWEVWFPNNPDNWITFFTCYLTTNKSDNPIIISVNFSVTGNFPNSACRFEDDFPQGNYYLALVDANNNGNLIFSQNTFVIGSIIPTNQPPTITSFTATPSSGILPSSGAGVPVTFTVVASDPDGTIVQAQWDFQGNGSVDQVTTTLTTSFTYTTTANPTSPTAIPFQPTVTVVDNGGATASSTTPVTIETPIQAITDLTTSVQELPLNTGQKNSLISKLNAASDAINRGNVNAACNQLSAFSKEVNALVQSQQLDQAIGNGLISETQAIQGSLGCR